MEPISLPETMQKQMDNLNSPKKEILHKMYLSRKSLLLIFSLIIVILVVLFMIFFQKKIIPILDEKKKAEIIANLKGPDASLTEDIRKQGIGSLTLPKKDSLKEEEKTKILNNLTTQSKI